MAQDDYYYEIQLTNKQLVFYFLAGATLLISSFLLGVMVGRGVDAGGGDVLAAKPVHEDKIVQEEGPKGQASAAPDLTYNQRLESEKPQEDLEKPASAESQKPGKASKGRGSALASPTPKPSPKADVTSPEATPSAAPSPKATPSPKPSTDASPATAAAATGPFTIQVGAFKDKASADSIVGRLKGKGYSAFVVATDGDLFNVRVGTYPSKTDAEKAMRQLRDEEKFRPFIVHP